MLRYKFNPDRAHHALAKGQADAYDGDNPETKIKGNLAEIAFYEFCRHTIPIDKWHWFNSEAFRRGEQEWNDHDFAIAGNTVDVKGRSSVSDIFDLGGIDSDLVALVGIPSGISDSVLEADSIDDFAKSGTGSFAPVVMMGLVETNQIGSEQHELHHPAPGGPSFERLDVTPLEQFPAGMGLSDWFGFGEEWDIRSGERFEGLRTYHTSANGETLRPGDLVTPVELGYKHGGPVDVPEKGFVVECPSEPAGAEFNDENLRYEQDPEGEYRTRQPAVGVIDVNKLSKADLNRIRPLSEEHLYPAIPQVVWDVIGEEDISYVPDERLTQIKSNRNLRDATAPLSNDWWESRLAQS